MEHCENIRIDGSSMPESKAVFLMDLFGGRRDIYAHRYYNARKRVAGYTVPCANRWDRAACLKYRKNRIPCTMCKASAFYRLNRNLIASHITNTNEFSAHNIAIFPVKQQKCSFVMIRLAMPDWLDVANALANIAANMNIQAAIERDPEAD